MNDIQDAGVNQQIVRRLAITDTAAPAASIAPEVFPVYQVAPPSQEDSLLRGELLCSAGTGCPAVALNHSGLSILNPAGSGILVMVDEIIAAAAGGVILIDGLVPAAAPLGGALSRSGSRDARIVPTTTAIQTTAGFYVGQAALPSFFTAGKILAYYEFLIADLKSFKVDYVVRPGFRYDVWALAINTGFSATLRWRERRAQPSELG